MDYKPLFLVNNGCIYGWETVDILFLMESCNQFGSTMVDQSGLFRKDCQKIQSVALWSFDPSCSAICLEISYIGWSEYDGYVVEGHP